MANFKTIDYSKMLVETMRAYHSVNAAGQLSYLYKFCLCCLYVLQTPFNNFHIWRLRKRIVAGCLWQMTHVKNVLNYLYDSTLNRIVISQSVPLYIYAPIIDEAESTVFAIIIDEGETTVYAPNIDDPTLSTSLVTIFVPATLYADPAQMSQLTADIELIKLKGILYQIASL